MPPIRVLVVDDHEMVRAGLQVLLAVEGLEVCGEAADGESAIALAEALAPDVVLLDVRLGNGPDGIDVARVLRRSVPSARLIVVSALGREEDLFSSLLVGAAGFLQKDVSRARLVEAIRAVAAGETLFDERLTESALARLHGDTEPADDPRLAKLSPRERDILDLLVVGRSNSHIASALHLSEKTVKNHVTRLFAKLGVSSRAEAVAYVAAHDRPVAISP